MTHTKRDINTRYQSNGHLMVVFERETEIQREMLTTTIQNIKFIEPKIYRGTNKKTIMTTPKKKFYERYWMGHTNNEGFSLLFISVGHRNYIEFVWIVNDSIYVLFSIDFFFLLKMMRSLNCVIVIVKV